jgi:hypothetical protein
MDNDAHIMVIGATNRPSKKIAVCVWWCGGGCFCFFFFYFN